MINANITNYLNTHIGDFTINVAFAKDKASNPLLPACRYNRDFCDTLITSIHLLKVSPYNSKFI